MPRSSPGSPDRIKSSPRASPGNRAHPAAGRGERNPSFIFPFLLVAALGACRPGGVAAAAATALPARPVAPAPIHRLSPAAPSAPRHAAPLPPPPRSPRAKRFPRASGLPAAHPNALAVVRHRLTIHGKVLAYTSTTGYMPIRNAQGKCVAHIFFIAYTKHRSGAGRPRRPLTFCFNGGPGAAANWLNLGCAGPVRVRLTRRGNAPPPPYQLASNAQTWLAHSDLVFVDPVGTGYSRAAPGVPGKTFYGVRADVKSIAAFIRLYVTLYQRWASPLFLAGESYGTTRACALADYLSAHDGIALNGIILISCALNFQVLSPSLGNDTPYPLFLPSYTAAAWYHHKLSPALEKHFHRTLNQVEHWALADYLPALAQGAALSRARRNQIAATLARYSGLSRRFILLSNLRVGPGAFAQALLRRQRRVIGRMDTRLTGYNPHPTAGEAPYDPALSRFLAPFTSAFNEYVRKDLHYYNNRPYKTLSNMVYPWNFGPPGEGFLYVTDNLRQAMIRDPYLKVLVCSGYFDLATPFFGTIYTINHLGLNRRLQANIQEVFFRGGHMLYHPAAMRRKLAGVVAAFIRRAGASAPRPPAALRRR